MRNICRLLAVAVLFATTTHLQAQITVDFRDNGTFNTPVFVENGLIATSTTGVGLLNLNGIGVVGGLSDSLIEAGETLEITLPFLSTDVILNWSPVISNFEFEFEVFRNGTSLGTMMLNPIFDSPINLNQVFAVDAIDAVNITGIGGVTNGDRLGSVTFTEFPAPVKVDFRDDGTFNTPVFVENGLMATSVTGVGLLNLNGIGVVGGLSDSLIETGETLEVMLPFLSTDVTLDWSPVSSNTEMEVEIFRDGASLGTLIINPIFDTFINLNMAFGVNAFDAFSITGLGGIVVGDRLGAVCFTEIFLGDCNCDGVVNLLDVDAFIALIQTGTYLDKADINGDGAVNLLDVDGFIAILSGG